MNDTLIAVSDCVKYLDVKIGTRLNMHEHVKYVTERITKLYGIISRIARVEWGLDFHSLQILYSALYMAITGYAVGAWFPLLHKKHKDSLESS